MYQFCVQTLQPYPLLLAALGVALLRAWRLPRERRGGLCAITVCFALVWLASTPLSAYWAAGLLEWRYPPLPQRPPATRVLVVLCGGLIRPDTPSEPSLRRAVYAAELYHAGPRCPVVVSGGRTDPTEPPEAEVVARLLRTAGVAPEDLILEDQSLNTAQNAARTAAVLRARGLTEGVVLVTSALHLRRATAQFQRQGVTVIPAGCGYRTDEFDGGFAAIWPKASALKINQEVWHELLGSLK